MNNPSKALVLSLIAVSSAVAQDTQATPPPSQAVPAQPAAAVAPAAAPTYTDAQLLEEFGWLVGKRTGLAEWGFTPDEADTIAKGVLGALNGKESPYEVQKIGPAMDEFIQKKQTVLLKAIKEKNTAQSALFFAKLKENKNVVELPDGLRYEITKAGVGDPPKPTDTVKVNYTGRLIDGKVFDSSDRAGKPAQFALDKVIPGWTEGLQKIGKGGKISLYVPPHLAYGDDGRPGIPPGSVLTFEIELLDILPPTAAEAPAAGNDAAPAAGK
jgi:FKBP-type peptidyl-prolyl cis-trans isomerase